jgi:hypothetical protein
MASIAFSRLGTAKNSSLFCQLAARILPRLVGESQQKRESVMRCCGMSAIFTVDALY